jgi:hypothetical protein
MATTQLIQLASAEVPTTPKDQFLLMAELCDLYGIQKNDVYGDFTANAESSWLRGFEKAVSERLGTEDGLFVVTGTMNQSIAAKIYQENITKAKNDPDIKDFVCHYSSHLVLHSNNSYPTLLGFNPVVVPPDPASDAPWQLQPLRYRCVEINSAVRFCLLSYICAVTLPHCWIGSLRHSCC